MKNFLDNTLETLEPLVPAHFFAFQSDLLPIQGTTLSDEHLLPDPSTLHGLRPFAQVYMGWNKAGLRFRFTIDGTFDQPEYPLIDRGDVIELFIDTRDVKTTAHNTRFCHHFFFLPLPFNNNGEEVQAGELTRFRTEDAHELCDPALLQVSKKQKNIEIFIPSEALQGYDPSQFDRLGFTYRIIRMSGQRQYFSANDEDFSIEQQPSLWATLKLVK